jgi:hypothetical protein
MRLSAPGYTIYLIEDSGPEAPADSHPTRPCRWSTDTDKSISTMPGGGTITGGACIEIRSLFPPSAIAYAAGRAACRCACCGACLLERSVAGALMCLRRERGAVRPELRLEAHGLRLPLRSFDMWTGKAALLLGAQLFTCRRRGSYLRDIRSPSGPLVRQPILATGAPRLCDCGDGPLSPVEDSNLQPDRYERSALTVELRARLLSIAFGVTLPHAGTGTGAGERRHLNPW